MTWGKAKTVIKGKFISFELQQLETMEYQSKYPSQAFRKRTGNFT